MSERSGLSRRAALAGIALGGAGVAARLPAAAREGEVEWTLDLDDAADNCKAVLKLQADLSGAQTMGGFPGEAWAWVPDEGNYRLFNTYGVGVSRIEFRSDENAWRFYHREVLLYLDPRTNEVLESWQNPWTGRRQEVVHILNRHVNRYYDLKPSAPFRFPWTYELNGDDLVFRISVFQLEDNVMPRKEYPLQSQSDKYQAAELWGMIGSLREVMDPDVSSASCVTSWSRVSGWLPFMEMGSRPGQMVYHSHAYKLARGVEQLPATVRDWLEKHGPEYLEAPREWNPPRQGVNAWNYSKALIDERRARGLAPGQTAFSWPPA